MSNRSFINPKGQLKFSVYEDGMLVKTFTVDNLVVTQGRTNILKLLGGDGDGSKISKVGVGTGSVAPSLADTAITSGFTKAIGSVSYPTTTSMTFAFNIGSAEANGKNIKEFGLFNDDDLLCARVVDLAGIEKTSAISIDGTWTIKVL